jgi:hypothetical protein
MTILPANNPSRYSRPRLADTARNPGRPWITVAVNITTRAVLGFAFSRPTPPTLGRLRRGFDSARAPR